MNLPHSKGFRHPNWIDGRTKDKLWIFARQNVRRRFLKFFNKPFLKSKVDPTYSPLRYDKEWKKMSKKIKLLIPLEYIYLKTKEEINEYRNSKKRNKKSCIKRDR